MNDFVPYANESDALTIGNLAVENGVDHIGMHGDVVLTKDKAGLVQARALKAVLDAIVKALEAEKQLPDVVKLESAVRIKNPLA